MNQKDQIFLFVSEFTGFPIEHLSLETTINDELGVDGDDGDEFLEEFAEKFNVDMNQLESVYFGPEGWPIPFLGFLLRLIGLSEVKYKKCSPLTIELLVKSESTGKWTEQ